MNSDLNQCFHRVCISKCLVFLKRKMNLNIRKVRETRSIPFSSSEMWLEEFSFKGFLMFRLNKLSLWVQFPRQTEVFCFSCFTSFSSRVSVNSPSDNPAPPRPSSPPPFSPHPRHRRLRCRTRRPDHNGDNMERGHLRSSCGTETEQKLCLVPTDADRVQKPADGVWWFF